MCEEIGKRTRKMLIKNDQNEEIFTVLKELNIVWVTV